MNHTPGPWHYYQHDQRGDQGAVKVETATEVVAEIVQRDTAERIANARLSKAEGK